MAEQTSETNYELRQRWQRKKEQLRAKVVILFLAYNVLALQFSSPRYSLADEVAQKLLDKPVTRDLLHLVFKIIAPLHMVVPQLFLSHLILVVFILTLLTVVLYIISRDPLSNSILLRQVYSAGGPGFTKWQILRRALYFRWWPWMREIVFYSHILPSNILVERCQECTRIHDCEGQLYPDCEKNTYYWGKIFSTLNNKTVAKILEATHSCRTVFFLKYGFLISAVFLFLDYLAVRLVEGSLAMRLNLNPALLIFALGAFLGYFAVLFANPVSDKGRGVWGNFYSIIRQCFSSKEFSTVFGRIVCKQGIDRTEDKRILSRPNGQTHGAKKRKKRK